MEQKICYCSHPEESHINTNIISAQNIPILGILERKSCFHCICKKYIEKKITIKK